MPAKKAAKGKSIRTKQTSPRELGNSNFTPVAVTGKRREKTYGETLKEVISDWRVWAVLLPVGMAVGIGSQFNWIQLKCEGQPFFTQTPEFCRQNLLRVILGGPIVVIVMALVAAGLRKLNPKIKNGLAAGIYIILLPIAALPLMPNQKLKDNYTTITAVIFVVTILFLLRNNIRQWLIIVLSKPKFALETERRNDEIVIRLKGVLSDAERDYIYDCVCDLVFEFTDETSSITVELDNLQGVESRFAFIFLILAGVSNMRGARFLLRGDKNLCDQVTELLKTTGKPAV